MNGTQQQLIGGGNPPLWVSGTAYFAGDRVWSPTDFQYYMRKSAGAGTTDPASDADTNWHPTGARATKSIQQGVISFSGSATTATATITAVNTAKAELRFLGIIGASADLTGASYIVQTNATTITATKIANTSTNSAVSWQLLESF